MAEEKRTAGSRRTWRTLFARKSKGEQDVDDKSGPSRWTMGILEDKETIEVPGMLLMIPKKSDIQD